MRFRLALSFVLLSASAAAAFVACSGSSSPDDGLDGAPTNGGGDSGSSTVDGTTGPGSDSSMSPGDGSSSFVCMPNPKNAEIPDNGCDDDLNGKIDDVPTCDGALDQTDASLVADASTAPSGSLFARAMGICDVATTRGFGLVDAQVSRGYGRSDEPPSGQFAVLHDFGSVIRPREGQLLGVLSSGYARQYDDAIPDGSTPFVQSQDWFNAFGGSFDAGNGTAPPGYPKAAPGCPQATGVNDVIDVKLTLKAPPNAKGISFDHDFWAADWPVYTCTMYNDAFVAYLHAQGFNGGKADNVAFDPAGAPMGVNTTFFNRCTPNSPIGCDIGDPTDAAKPGISTCTSGEAELSGTGYGTPEQGCELDASAKQSGGGATGWLTTVAPVNPGETFTLELFVWDAYDAAIDSTVILDHFHWLDTAPAAATTTRAK
jgi:hypothetical protein